MHYSQNMFHEKMVGMKEQCNKVLTAMCKFNSAYSGFFHSGYSDIKSEMEFIKAKSLLDTLVKDLGNNIIDFTSDVTFYQKDLEYQAQYENKKGGENEEVIF